MTQKQIDAIKPGDILFANEREEGWGWTTQAIIVARVEKNGSRTYIIPACDDGCEEFTRYSTSGKQFWDKLKELIPQEGYCEDPRFLSIKSAASAGPPYTTMLTYYAHTAGLRGKLTVEKLAEEHRVRYGGL